MSQEKMNRRGIIYPTIGVGLLIIFIVTGNMVFVIPSILMISVGLIFILSWWLRKKKILTLKSIKRIRDSYEKITDPILRVNTVVWMALAITVLVTKEVFFDYLFYLSTVLFMILVFGWIWVCDPISGKSNVPTEEKEMKISDKK